MKHYTHIIFIILTFLSESSCKKEFLEVPDKGVALRQTYITDLKTTNDYLNGIYIELSQGFYQGYTMIYSDLVADNIKLSTLSSTNLGPHYNWAQFSDLEPNKSYNMNGVWLDGYHIIRSCNFVLEKVEEFRGQDSVKADNLKAQAYGLRALLHFVLVNIFAQSYNYTSDGSHLGIPYVTTSDWTVSVTRNSVGEVYMNIIDDLESAISLYSSGPTSSADILYLNRNAAKALLARVCLFKGDYLAAKNIAREIIVNTPLLTIANGYPDNLYKNLAPTQTESLFQLSPSQSGITLPSSTGGSYTGTYTTDFQGRYFISTKKFVATGDIATILTQNSSDVRKNWVKLSSGSYNITKYPLNVISGFSSSRVSGSYYETLFRSSEMFLTTAEAYSKLGNEDSARYYLDAIRKRANPSISTITVTGSALQDSIYKERRKELAFEGFRMFDLLRWKKDVTRLDAWSSSIQIMPYPNNKAIAPIPGSDVDITGLLQNPSY